MKKSELEKYKTLHQSGHLEKAKQGYLSVLAKNPHDIAALELLATIYIEERDLAAAQRSIEQALEIDSENRILRMHLANILKLKGDYEAASQLLHEIIADTPNDAAAYNNLGTVFYAQGKFQEAIPVLKKAIEIQPDFADAYYNLGLAYLKAKQTAEAISVFQSLLLLSKHHPGAQFQLGCLYMQQFKYSEAADYFLKIATQHPYHFETQSNLATCYFKLGKLNEAKKHYLQAVEIIPSDTQILFNLGVISMQQGFMREASDYFLRVVKLNPDTFEAHNNLGVTLLAQHDFNAALQHFREALRIQPQNVAVRHTVDILSQKKTISTSPAEYISSLFDSYADHYDAHLLFALNYQVPKLLFNAVSEVLLLKEHSLNILDLGCGTGLCGELLKPYAKKLTGVDLSANMLNKAAEKHIYDALKQSDLLTFLQETQEQYDLIIAGDVLVYIGDLASILSAVSAKLNIKGLFAFNTEISKNENFKLTPSGRFAHRKEYIERLVQENHLQILSYQTVATRSQEESQVVGHLYVLQKI